MNKINKENTINNIKVKSLIPQQQSKVASRLRRSADYYQQRFIKFPHVGIFHSYSELLHAALLESNPKIQSFIPQPIQFKIQRKLYIPDVYYIIDNKTKIIEIKSDGKFKDEFKIPLEEFLEKQGMEFLVVSNEEILEQEFKALNWLNITRTLVNSRDIDTTDEEVLIMDKFYENPEQELGDIIHLENRSNCQSNETALFRLIHDGKLKISCNGDYLNNLMEVSKCI